ncbi:MAG: ABC transporter substrate-binding protein [Pseudonocardia sp.]|nr:ABC transporter substrate-binding protein [Pseudonocardia sp.]
MGTSRTTRLGRCKALVPALALALATAACGGAGGSGQSAEGCTLTLGATGPMTGPSAAWGIAMAQSAQMAAWEANQRGGLKVGGKTCRVNVETYDDLYTSNGAAAAMNKFAADGIKFVIGPMGSPEVTGAKPVAARHGMLLMADSFARDAIGPKWPLTFHNGPGASVWAQPIIAEARKHYTINSVVTVAPDDQGGQDTAEVDAQAYQAAGVPVRDKVYYARDTSDFASVASRMLASHPDAVETASTPPGNAGVLVKQLRQLGFRGPIGHLGGPGTEQIAQVAGGYPVLGDFYAYAPYNPDDSKIKQFQQELRQALNADTQPNTPLWTPGARLVLAAIEKAGTTDDVQAVATALRAMPLDDPMLGHGEWTGQREFGINQEASYPFYIQYYTGGQLQPYVQLSGVTG